jgi:hypothetical protein
MTSLIAQPQLMGAAATDLAQINSAIDAAKAAAAGPTTGVLAAAQDEVSAAAAKLFGGFGQEYQAILKQAAAFHEEFVAALSGAGSAYTQAEAANAGAIASGAATTPLLKALASPAQTINLIMGASGYPIPSQEYIDGIPMLFGFPTGTNVGINTPEGLYPLTGIKDLTFDVSAARGLTILDNAIRSAATGNTSINVFGYSQSAAIASMEMHALNPTNTPGAVPAWLAGKDLTFTLVGDVSNPNGGVLPRFPGLSLSALGFTFGTATPDNSFPTRIYTIEYDGFADFPQYPINVVSDLNAFLGIIELHGGYPFLTPAQLAGAIPLTTTGPVLTQYYMVDTGKFPLTDFIRDIPVVGNPVADLLEPDLKVIVNLGYGSTDVGYSQSPANVPTPFGLFPHVPIPDIISALNTGTHQGVSAFTADVNSMLTSPPSTTLAPLTAIANNAGSHLSAGLTTVSSALSSPDSFLTAVQAVNTRITDAISTSASAAYATLLPTADVASGLLLSVPAYNLNLRLDGLEQILGGDVLGGLQYALVAPMAVNGAMYTLSAGFEFRVIEHAASTIISAWTGTTPAPPGDTVSL